MAFRLRLTLLLLVAGLCPATADDAAPTALDKERQTLESYATTSPTCREWTDGCAVCARHVDGTAFDCSLPGIACQPTGLICRTDTIRTPEIGKPDTPTK